MSPSPKPVTRALPDEIEHPGPHGDDPQHQSAFDIRRVSGLGSSGLGFRVSRIFGTH